MKLIIFDFDGVIANTFDIAMEVNLLIDPEITEEKYRSYFRGNFYSTRLKNEVKTPAKNISFFDEYSKRIVSISTNKAIKEEITALAKKYSLAIVSSTISPIIKDYLNKEGLLGYFSEIYGSDIEKSKVVKLRRLLSEYNLDSQDAIFITDTTGDIREGREVGIESIGVTWGYLPKEELESEKPFAVIDDPNHITGTVNRYFGE